MRSKFIVKIPAKSDHTFPTDEDLRVLLRIFGWEQKEIAILKTEHEKIDAYVARGQELFTQQLMPEVAQEEKNDIIFCGFLSADQTRFVVTRSNDGEMTFRLLQPELQQLIRATEKIIRAIEAHFPKPEADEHIINRSILIYERSHDHVILEGRVIENKYLESLRTNIKDTIVVISASILLIILGIILFFSHFTAVGSNVLEILSRAAVSIMVVFLVSIIGLYLTYRDIKTTRVISWNLKRTVGA